MLELDTVSKSFTSPGGGTLSVLSDFSLKVDGGEFVSVTGPSGCGKSTLLSVCGALLRPDAGRVRLADADVYSLSANERAHLRARSIGFVFQQFHLIPYMSVRDNVLAPTLASSVENERERADELLARFGLRERVAHVPSQLSSGERQRVGLARALLPGPRIILADEPTGNLDEANGRVVLDALAEFASGGGAVLMATHNAGAAARASRRVDLGVTAASRQ
jgi:putative ABC transport system ATP-binding protein